MMTTKARDQSRGSGNNPFDMGGPVAPLTCRKCFFYLDHGQTIHNDVHNDWSCLVVPAVNFAVTGPSALLRHSRVWNSLPGVISAESTIFRVGPGHPSSPLSIYFLIFSPFYFSLSFIGFTYFLLLSIPSLSTRIVPLRFQAGGCRRRPNLGLVCVLLCNLCYLYSLVKMDCGVLFYLV